jgi:hypothetical protein
VNNAPVGSPKGTAVDAFNFDMIARCWSGPPDPSWPIPATFEAAREDLRSEDDRLATLEAVRHAVHAARVPHGTGVLIGSVMGAALWIGISFFALKLFGN